MKDLKTTTAGIVLGILMAVQPIIETGQFETAKDWFKLIIGIAIAALGFLAKDSDAGAE